MVLRRSAGFQTGLQREGGLVDALQPEDTLSRFGNQRSAKDFGIRPLGTAPSRLGFAVALGSHCRPAPKGSRLAGEWLGVSVEPPRFLSRKAATLTWGGLPGGPGIRWRGRS